MAAHRILLIDSYDSFANNLAALIHQSIPSAIIHIIQNDDLTIEQLLPHLSAFSAVIIGPGPGSPAISQDVGVIPSIWDLPEEFFLPVFGVCLGLQSLCLHFGGEVCGLQVVKHGQISRITHDGTGLFKNTNEVLAVRYHSLHVRLSENSVDIEPLAWTDDGEENGRVLMAARHLKRPFWAVQYHPESVCTSGDHVLANFWDLAQSWSCGRNRMTTPFDGWPGHFLTFPPIPSPVLYLPAPNGHDHNLTSHSVSNAGQPNGHSHNRSQRDFTSGGDVCYGDRDVIGSKLPNAGHPNIQSAPSTATLRHVVVKTASKCNLRLCEYLGVSHPNSEFVMLESAAKPGRFSILGLVDSHATKITYSVGDPHVRLVRVRDKTDIHLPLDERGDIWGWLTSYMKSRKVVGGPEEVPFWAGLVGHLSYELGVASVDVQNRHRRQGRHDVNLAFVERSIVIDHGTGNVYIQSLLPDDPWIDSTRSVVEEMAAYSDPVEPPQPAFPTKSRNLLVTRPNRESYISKIHQAQAYLAEGQSYELCVTALTRVKILNSAVDPSRSPWAIYRCLRRYNPAPHAAYIRLSGVSLLCSSPERFLSWNRTGLCQLRPIKGTVRKSPQMTQERATQILNTPKELAENLMIVDLIRHDLHQIAGGSVQVTQLMGVEEYETVFHLVSVIEGQIDVNGGMCGGDVLAKSLPPGSMTGAPKKRSVDLLQSLEDEERGIYSGVSGYWCAGGGGDWSVVIRSCFRYDGDDSTGKAEQWYIGAGGAITALSDPEDEWDEMETKLRSTLRALELFAA